MEKLCLTEEELVEALMEGGVEESQAEQALDAWLALGFLTKITRLWPLQQGMTNQLFRFECDKKEYLLRLPGAGSEKLVNRWQEAEVYRALAGKEITDKAIYMNPFNGIKVTEYLADSVVCNSGSKEQVRRCMRHLYHFHRMQLPTQQQFDIFRKIEEYEAACGHPLTCLPGYESLRQKIMALEEEIQRLPREKCLCHIDPVTDNFLLQGDKIRLIDWEYAALCDPHVDIAMFCIYAGYGKKEIDETIDFYFKEGCEKEIRRKIYLYIAACGFLWTIWCEIKKDSGIDYGEYEAVQYRYAEEFVRL